MPLSLYKLGKTDYRWLLHKINVLLASWKGSLISRERRLVLLKCVLSSVVVYMMTTHQIPPSVLQKKQNAAMLGCGAGKDHAMVAAVV